MLRYRQFISLNQASSVTVRTLVSPAHKTSIKHSMVRGVYGVMADRASSRNESVESNGLVIKTHSIIEDYEVKWGEKLGCGISGPVRPCRCRKTGQQFALKCLTDRPRARQEIQLQFLCRGHPNIVDILDVYSNEVRFPSEPQPRSRLLIVMELMEGGELFERISKHKYFTEYQAAKYTKQISLAILCCHSKSIAHRDIKPENLLLKDNSEEAVVKLSDFGFAKLDDGNLKTPHFTPYYVAPQVLVAQKQQGASRTGSCLHPPPSPYTYDKSCDMWSLGVIVYIMLCGYPPFYSEVPNKQMTSNMRKKILAGQYEFPMDDWSYVSPDAIDLVKRLLKVNPLDRLRVEQVLSHPWLQNAPQTQLQSPAILSDKSAAAMANEAHGYQLTTMRMPDVPVTLKPLLKVNNPILKKRGTTPSTSSTSEHPAKLPCTSDSSVDSITAIINLCLLTDANQEEKGFTEKLNSLVSSACRYNASCRPLWDALRDLQWNGEQFEAKINRKRLAQVLSEVTGPGDGGKS